MVTSLIKMNKEEWRPVLGFEGSYEVSSHGGVRSLDRAVTDPFHGVRQLKGFVKKQTNDAKGYKTVSMRRDGKSYQPKVHVLVAEAFLGERPEWSTMVNHKNKIVFDNRVENLEWSNNSHNQRHATACHLYDGELRSYKELSEIAGLPYSTLQTRIKRWGWSIEKAVSAPVQKKANH